MNYNYKNGKILLILFFIFHKSNSDMILNKMTNNNEKSRAIYRLNDDNINSNDNDDSIDESIIRDTLNNNYDRKNPFSETSTFDPDVLNKFLDEYSNKMKSTTEKNFFSFLHDTKIPVSVTTYQNDKLDSSSSTQVPISPLEDSLALNESTSLETYEKFNDTFKRNKFYNTNADNDRNGWVTLEAIPWSKSKISKWQANPTSPRPWLNNKWNKFNNEQQWQKPHYDNYKPGYDDTPPGHWPNQIKTTGRPHYNSDDRYESGINQAQKWPPEKWSSNNKYKPNSDLIITDDGPPDFPTSNWDKYDEMMRPAPHSPPHKDYNNNNNNNNYENENNWPPNNNKNHFDDVKDKPSYGRPNNYQRPHFASQYEYENHHPLSHPSSGDGQWVLLSTNRGYSKSRQRSLKFNDDEFNNKVLIKTINKENGKKVSQSEASGGEVITSKRQVRLTVLPSLSGTNTTTSHGGLLEVEKTFKTVDESQKEFEQAEKLTLPALIKRPLRQSIKYNNRPSNSAGVLAAVSAGMLPATMAMVLPMMLGRKRKRSIQIFKSHNKNNNIPYPPQYY